MWKHGPYDPIESLRTKSKNTSLFTAECADDVGGQLLDAIRKRHGLGPSEVKIKRWSPLRGRERAWEARKKREAEREAERKKKKK